ncbi:MAG: 2-oxo acid dehydrogenase subunit E2 [Clostridia bacterium]
MFGLRSDGKKLKKLSAIMRCAPHIAKERNDSQNLHKCGIDCEPMDNFIKEKSDIENVTYTYMDIVFSALVKTFALRPWCNRFVMNGRVYKHNTIEGTYVLKKNLADDGQETTVKLSFSGKENISEVRNIIDSSIDENRKPKKENLSDKFVKKFKNAPNFVMKCAFGCAKILDKHGLLPKGLISASPFHSSFLLTNLKSIKTEFIYHHLYNFGTCGLFVTMGKENMQAVVDKTNKIVAKKIMDLGIVMDDRFVDGFYWSKSLKLFKNFLENPHSLEHGLAQIVQDIN